MKRIPKEELLEKLMKNVYPEPNTGCWLWSGMVNVSGYGIMKAASLPQFKTPLTHRLSYFLHKGEFDYSLNVLHKCDNPICVNPEHLFLGTHLENMIDRKTKNRTNRAAPKGSKCGASKITEDVVLKIRSITNKTQKQIADSFGLTQSAVHYIVSGKTWKHI
jgi:hypothetical protein